MEVALAEVRLPRVAVRVELHERERPLRTRERPQLGERDRVVAAHRERADTALGEGSERILDAPIRPLGVSRSHGKVAVVGDGDLVEQVEPEAGVVGAQERRRGANGLGAEAGAGPEARGRIEWDPEDCHLEGVGIDDMRQAHERPDAREAGNHLRVERPVALHAATLWDRVTSQAAAASAEVRAPGARDDLRVRPCGLSSSLTSTT